MNTSTRFFPSARFSRSGLAGAVLAALSIFGWLSLGAAHAESDEPAPAATAFEYEDEEWADPRFDAPLPDAPAAEEPPPENGIVLNFRDASLDAVLDYLSETAGFAVVRDAEVRGRVTLMSRRPVSPDEAVDLLSTVLKDRGFAAILTGRTLRVLPLNDAKKANIPVTSGNDPDAIPESDRIATHIIPLRFVDAGRLKDDLAPLLPAYAEMAANASSNSLILTDTQTNIRRVMHIVRALDTHMAAVADVKVFTLRYASATTTARLVNEIFQEDQPAQQQVRGAAAAAAIRRFRGQQTGQETGETRQPQRVHAAADDRTNTVVVTGPPDVLEIVERVVEELDANPQVEQAVMTYRLRNAQSENLANTLNSLFSEMRERQDAATARTARDIRTRGTTTRRR